MELFREVTRISKYKSVENFVREIKTGETDFIFASKAIFETYFAKYDLKGCVHYKSEYGNGEPTDLMIEKLRTDFYESGCERIIAIGGGAVIDMAKILVLDVSKEVSAEQIFRKEVKLKKKYPLITVPTTCGAGSEVSSVSIMEVPRLHTKLGLADPGLFPDEAILIPELLRQLPFSFFATSAIDAMIHAMESFVSPKANLYTEMFSKEAIKLLVKGFGRLAEEGKEARMEMLEEFLVASNLAGIAFANAGTGTVHALSYPLSGTYHVTHGEANYQFLTAVFGTYQRLKPDGKIRQITSLISRELNCQEEEAYNELEKLLCAIVPRKPLHEYGMKEEEIKSFPKSVAESQQRLLNQSYIKLSEEQMEEIYRKLY